MNKIKPYYKAVVGFLAPGATVIIASVTEASAGGTAITSGEWITAACTSVVTAAGVGIVANKPRIPDGTGEHRKEI